MPICTYLTGNEYTEPTSDAELNQLLGEVRRVTGEDWRIRETRHEQRRWFRRKRVLFCYELFCRTPCSCEFQIINLYRPDRDDDDLPSINTVNEATHVAAFLYGVLAGCNA